MNGKNFVTCKNLDKGGRAYLYGLELVDQQEDSVYPTNTVSGSSSDVLNAKFLKVNNTWFTVLCHMTICVIYNQNCTRKLFTIELDKK